MLFLLKNKVLDKSQGNSSLPQLLGNTKQAPQPYAGIVP